MRKTLAVLYTVLALGANPALAEDPAALREGDMKKLALHEAPVALPEAALVTLDDAPASLAEYRGKWVVLNFWATWCAPCRAEMPSLDRLQAALPDLAVVPVATGRNEPAAITRFYEEAGIANLPVLRDPKSGLSRQMGIMALPVTVILNPEGQEVARLIGDAEWDSASAQAVLSALMAGP
ncbi:Thiol:disulfide interchange protein TlpA [Pseudogemmobacter humi]|uniref:Thiol:disulfide interchange protein TlpA n=2 Tax=Pseudogemmobacter humi TaxID=2483812 RepID=A0A3P5WW08_9RHOB|nr:Thiol:disulfide interchange protein TlpA [Pseudogemmobacter humi]